MQYYFEKKENQDRLFKKLTEWIDTPFRHKCCVKNLGCDCIHFVIGVLDELNLCSKKTIEIPDYPPDWHYHNTRELLAEGLEREFNVEKFNICDNPILLNGDIILSHYGKASSHAGIYFNDYVYQSLNNIGVKKINFSDKKFRKGMKFIYRIKMEYKR